MLCGSGRLRLKFLLVLVFCLFVWLRKKGYLVVGLLWIEIVSMLVCL